jgi:LysR family transcriptional regulator, cell division regulator
MISFVSLIPLSISFTGIEKTFAIPAHHVKLLLGIVKSLKMIMWVDLKDLTFIARVAQTGSVTAAANILGCVQSNVTNRLKRLEADLGFALFTRAGGRMVPSPAAQVLARAAGEVESLIGESIVEARRLASGQTTLRLGMMESVAAAFLPQLMQRLADSSVSIVTGPSADIAERIRNGSLDIGIISQHVRTLDLDVVELISQRLVLARSLNATGLDLDCVAVIRGTDALLRARIVEAVTRVSGRMPTILELGSLDALRAVVESGTSCAVMPEFFYSGDFSDKVEVESLPRDDLEIKVCAIRRKENTMHELWARITDFFV